MMVTPPLLVVGGRPALRIMRDLYRLGIAAERVEGCEHALVRLRGRRYAAVIVNVARPHDWPACGRIAAAADCPVVVVTHFLARDRRFRDFAFGARVAGYVCPPYTRARWRETLQRVAHGERGVEMIGGAGYCEH